MINTIKLCIEVNKKKYFFNTDIKNINSIEKINSLLNTKIDLGKNDYYYKILNNSEKILTNEILTDLLDSKELTKLNLEVMYKLKGGLGIAMFAVLIYPMISIGKGFLRIIEVIEKFFMLFVDIMEMVPLIFDPPALMDDIMFAVTFGINKVFQMAMESIKGSREPEDDDAEKGPFGVKNSENIKCMDPSFSTILLLIVCPPLAIFFKLGFLKGFISAIICGVLCVKLYYFPGLLFAILHVLC